MPTHGCDARGAMPAPVDLDDVCFASDDVVFREIEGEVVIIPLAAGVGDTEDELYSLNETGKAIWSKLDGRRTLGQVAEALEKEYDASPGGLRSDVLGFASELVRRRILAVKA
jgi:hypothetical protein